jgi:Uma2 family endonuclease
LITVVNESRNVVVPSWVDTLEDFRRWLDSDDSPENARVWFLNGNVWVDMSKEQIYTHVQVKTKFIIVVGGLVEAKQSGLFLADGAYLTNIRANISGNPDALFVANEALTSGRVRLIEGAEEGYVELEGTPDMVLEVISESSVTKDTITLKEAYWQAGVREYWLVDARTEPLRFDIFRHALAGYVATRKQAGWLKSAVFGKSFRLTKKTGALGHPEFVLDVR